jgi:hypothetical protein
MPKPKPARKLTLIVSDEKQPSVALKPGMKLDVVSVKLADPKLKPPGAAGARLCGGSGTCLALVELGDDVINPPKK